MTIFTARVGGGEEKLLTKAYRIQGNTLNATKIDDFFALFGLTEKVAPDVRRRALLLINLRNRLSHHWPLVGDIRDYPVHVIAALDDAQIERVNTSWTAQCSDVRLVQWSAKVVRAFIDEWWRLGQRVPASVERLHWEYGPDWVYPSETTVSPAKP